MSSCSRSSWVLPHRWWCIGHGEVLSQPLEAQCSPALPGIMPEGSGEGTFALSECETSRRGVDVRPATRCGAARVRNNEPGISPGLRVRPCDHPQQLTLGGPFAT